MEEYYVCEDCEEYFSELISIGDKEVCEECFESYVKCDKCGEYHHVDEDCKFCKDA
jgi:hypothetical protein